MATVERTDERPDDPSGVMHERMPGVSAAASPSRSPATPDEGRYLLCRAGEAIVAVPLAHACETLRPLPITRVEGMPAFVAGVAVIRGAPTPVVDVGALLFDDAEREPARFVTVRTGERVAALAFEEVLGVRELSRADTDRLPPLLGRAAPEIAETLGVLDAALLFVLDEVRAIPASAWNDPGPEEARP